MALLALATAEELVPASVLVTRAFARDQCRRVRLRRLPAVLSQWSYGRAIYYGGQ